MGKINVLSFAVANLIAAGEVVDRPSSVIKELVENSIDAGADRITVEIQNGGISLMRVSDNGCGMEAEDLPVALRRHATSKIKDATDLDAIMSLGFRGEALAAISSVSNVRIISKQKESAFGAMIEAHGGTVIGVTERGASDGTTVIVENLFYNVPARRKFLKKDVTEAMAVATIVEKVALSHPEIAFRLISDGVTRLETSGDGKALSTIYSVFGRDFASKLLPVDSSGNGIRITGYIGRSDNVRANRNYQNFFINGRYVKSKTAMAALEQAFSSYIPPERFPCCVIFIDIDARTVDVNVHPAKLEVKFSNEKAVFESVYYAIRNTLEKNTTRPEVRLENGHIQAAEYRNFYNGKTSTQRSTAHERKSDPIRAFVPIKDNSRRVEQIRYDCIPEKNETQRIFNGEPARNDSFAAGTESKNPQSTLFHVSDEPSGNMSKTPFERFNKEVKQTASTSDEVRNSEYKENGTISLIKTSMTPAIGKVTDIQRTVVDDTEKAAISDTETSVDNTVDAETCVLETNTEGNNTNTEREVPTYRIIGEAFNSYVFVDLGQKLLIIDKHAAHERIIFENFKEIMQTREQASQMLMLPITVNLGRDECNILREYRVEIESVGFTFDVSENTVEVQALPTGIAPEAVPDIMQTFADHLKNNTGNVALTRTSIFEKALYQASCKAAIKAGRKYADEHIEWICRKIMEIPDITFCPHGRPVAIEMSKTMLDKQFERL